MLEKKSLKKLPVCIYDPAWLTSWMSQNCVHAKIWSSGGSIRRLLLPLSSATMDWSWKGSKQETALIQIL